MTEKKEKSSDYKSGYGQAKSDILRFINEAIVEVNDAIDNTHVWIDEVDGGADKINKVKNQLKIRTEELRRIRAFIRAR